MYNVLMTTDAGLFETTNYLYYMSLHPYLGCYTQSASAIISAGLSSGVYPTQ